MLMLHISPSNVYITLCVLLYICPRIQSFLMLFQFVQKKMIGFLWLILNIYALCACTGACLPPSSSEVSF